MNQTDLTGHTLARYHILEVIGAGGMGMVYRALDTILDRSVAVKVLLRNRPGDDDQRRRFMQEAKAASSLNHPSIVTIYEIGEQEEICFIAMEYVAGKRLDHLMSGRGLPVAEVLKYGVQIADALAAAHSAGIIHRDLKPGNIMVTDKGLVKVLDFGLAKLTDPFGPDDRTISMSQTPLTVEGTLVGTVAYMSPEQAEGRPVDARSDVFCFGSVLYEMLSGRRPFHGENNLSTLMAIVSKEPSPVSDSAEGTQQNLERLILRCLRKDPDQRFQNMDDVKLELVDLQNESIIRGTTTSRSPFPAVLSPGVSRARPSRAVKLIATGALAALALLGITLWRSSRPDVGSWQPVMTRLTSDPGMSAYPAVSRDGKLVAFASDRSGQDNLDIWVQQIGGGDPIRITTDPADEYEPAFSPDGTTIAFSSNRSGGGIYVVSTLGGVARLVADHGRRPLFSPDGRRLVYWVGGDFGEVFVTDMGGGAPHPIQPEFFNARYPVWSPDGKNILFNGAMQAPRDKTGVTGELEDWWVARVDGGAPIMTGAFESFKQARLLAPFGMRTFAPAAWTSEHEVIFSARLGGTTNVWKIPISPRSMKVDGAPERLTLGTALELQPSFAAWPGGGRGLVFASLTRVTDVWSLPVDTNRAKVLGAPVRVTREAASAQHPTLSPDGKTIAYSSTRSGLGDIWLRDLETGKESALTVTPQQEEATPWFSGDGSKIAYVIRRSGVSATSIVAVTRGPDGQWSVPGEICTNCGVPISWSRNGKHLLFGVYSPARAVTLDPAGRRVEVLRHPQNNVWQWTFSPDDRWISFNMTTSPVFSHIHVAPFSGKAEAIPVGEWIPITGGKAWDDKPRWSPDGATLYFVSERDGFRCLWYQRLDPRSKHPVGAPAPLYHFHGARLSLRNLEIAHVGVGVGQDKIILNLGELTGNVWMAETQERK